MTKLLQPESQRQTDDIDLLKASIAGGQTDSRFRRLVIQFLPRGFLLLGITVVSTVLLAALLELASWAIWSIRPIGREAELENQGASPVYAGADWAQEFWREESLRRQQLKPYVPFRVWGVTEWHSRFINNDTGAIGALRRTLNLANCGLAHRTIVWSLGGSTMYGTGVPDFATIPSYLSHELNSGSPDCVVVFNLGVEGYVTDQEMILLEEQLKAGGRPDIVVFYDGVNDSSLAWAPSGEPAARHFLFGTVKSRVEGSLSGRLDFLQKSYTSRLTRAALTQLRPASSLTGSVAAQQPHVDAIFNNYEGNMRIARALAEAYGFKVYCFWQPLLTYGHKPLVPFEQEMVTRDATGTSYESLWFLTMNSVYQQAERHASTDGVYVFLAGLFDSTKAPLYVDEAHLGPLGNEIVAHAIGAYIRSHSGP